MSLLESVERGITRLLRRFTDPRRRTWRPQETPRPRETHEQVHADERTIRRTAETQDGGTSSEESRAAYERGDHPGGLHGGGKSPNMPHRGQDD